MSKSKASAALEPVMINDSNLSRAWARLLLGVLDGAGTEVSPLVLSVTGFGENDAVAEDPAVRQALDQLLKSFRSGSGRCRVATGPAFLRSIARRSRVGRR